ncbi:MAG TPA: phosphatase PAP2 family protein [Roseiarcus sp.]|nr:phosphatase PAP2 family protein [Roseiarcus sp.]
MASPRAILIVALLLTVVAAVFALWPEFDLAAARAFHDENGFIGQRLPAGGIRDFFRAAPFVVLFVLAALYALKRYGLDVPGAPSGRALVFLVATMAIGPGLIVNLGLKDHAHRPRPSQTQEFGGSWEFRPWWRFDGACPKNCSFVSGEASEAFWMVAPASLAPPPLRPFAIGAALLFGAAAGLMRMAAGGHFLSDVLISALLTILVAQIGRRLILGSDDG